jgi:hypothetical protein
MHETARRLRDTLIRRALEGPGTASPEARRAAFENRPGSPGRDDGDARLRALLDKVARNAWKVTAADVDGAKAGHPEDAIFELSVCAALGQASRQLSSALAVLDAATGSGSASTPTSD